MPFNNGSFVSSVSRFCTLTTLCPSAHPPIGHIREYAPQVTIAFKPSSTIARGGGTAIYELIGMCRCEGYGFQAVYPRIGYINQSVWV